jgi:uncharacterized membrane protein
MNANRRLKYERQQRGWSQARVAEQIGADAVNVSRWERGASSPSPFFQERMCLLFGKSAQELGFLPEVMHNAPEQWGMEEQGDALLATAQGARELDRFRTLSVPTRVLASLSYLLAWGSGLIIFLFCRTNRFICFHSIQSIFFFSVISLWYIVYDGVVSYLPFAAITTIATIVSVLVAITGILGWLTAIVQALRGKYYLLPFVGNLSLKATAALARQSPPLTSV